METGWHVATAAEAIVAAQFARLGFDVAVQYGANQPEYDLTVTRGDDAQQLKISVKGSNDGGWGLTQTFLQRAAKARNQAYKTENPDKPPPKAVLTPDDYHRAADEWLKKHKAKTALCLVQFIQVPFDQMPHVYLATPAEIAQRLKDSRGGFGDSALKWNLTRGPKAKGAGTVESLPDEWRISEARVVEVMKALGI